MNLMGLAMLEGLQQERIEQASSSGTLRIAPHFPLCQMTEWG